MGATALVALFGVLTSASPPAGADGRARARRARAPRAARALTMDDAQLRAAIDAVLAASAHADWSRWRAAVGARPRAGLARPRRLGGSMTLGHGCVEPGGANATEPRRAIERCARPWRLGEWLAAAYDGGGGGGGRAARGGGGCSGAGRSRSPTRPPAAAATTRARRTRRGGAGAPASPRGEARARATTT